MRQLAACAMACALAGCAANNVADLKSGAATKFEFDAKGNYQQVYRDIAQTARECWVGGYIISLGASRNLNADLFPDLKKGEITWWQSNVAQSYYATALIEPTGDENAHVTVWSYYHTWDHIGPDAQKWAAGSKDC